MEQQTTIRIVTLKDLWSIFVHRLWIIALSAVVAMGGMFLFVRLTGTAEYESTATLYILRQDQNETANNASDDFSLALKVVGDCDYLLKSHAVLDTVIDELNLDIPYERLRESVSTSNPENTRILEVTVVSESPEQAKRIVDSVCRVGTEKIAEAMGFNQVHLYEYGVLNPKPCNTAGLLAYLLTGIAAAVLVYTAFLIAFLLDDRIRTEEDIERELGLSVLGDIPDANASKKGRCGYCSAHEKQKAGKREGN